MSEPEIPLDQLLKEPYQAGREYSRLGNHIGHFRLLRHESINTAAIGERQKRIGSYATLNYDNNQWEMFRTGMNTFC